MTDEVPLSGGNVATNVVRVGNTVRKPVTQHVTATRALLDQLQTANIKCVPRFLGLDDQNRQSLSFVPGAINFPTDMWTQQRTLLSAVKLLRQIHDASTSLLGHDLPWAYQHPVTSQQEAIGHSDFAPYNMTFADDGTVIGVFDFDLAGPAPRGRDLAYLAWWIVPLGQQDRAMQTATLRDLADGSRRLQLLCETYGLIANESFISMIHDVLHHMSDPNAVRAMIGHAATNALITGGHLDHWAQAKGNFEQIRPQIAANLGRGADPDLAKNR